MTLVWRRLLAVLPERRGVLLLDDTAFLKQRRHSVGVTRQYASARHHVTNCQVAVTAALWTHARAWLVGAESYVSESWLTPEARTRARIPAARQFSEKSRLALRLVQRVRAAQLEIEAVVANAGYGNVVALTALGRGCPVSWASRRIRPSSTASRRCGPAAAAGNPWPWHCRHGGVRGSDPCERLAVARVAVGCVRQWPPTPMARPICGAARGALRPLAPASPTRSMLVAVRTQPRPSQRDAVLFSAICPRRRRSPGWRVSRISGGPSNSNTRI